MSVYLLHDKTLEFPIVFDQKSHVPDTLILRYAISKHQYPNIISDRLTKRCSKKTVVDAVQRISYLINQLAIQKQTDESTGVHYLAATYHGNMEPLIRAMRYKGDWGGESIEQYVKAWRQFYRFLTQQGVEHEMMMPQTNDVVIKQDIDDNFLSHTTYRHEQIGEQETAIDENWKERRDDYKDKIISMEQFWLLYAGLHEEDPVYAVMAYAELVTCLRVTALIDCFPMSPNKNNPKWLSFREMLRDNVTSQRLRYVAKGGLTKSLLAPVTLMDVICGVYEKPEIGPSYSMRLKAYENKYCKTAWARNKGCSPDKRPTWLLKTGTPVSVRSYQKAMQDTGHKIGIKVHPHMLRHTGVTQMLYRWIKNNELMTGFNHTNSLLIADAHIILQAHLGHARVDTTKRYVRTIERIIQESQLDLLLNSTLTISKKHHDMLEKNPKLAKGLEVLEKAILGADKQLDFTARG
jgi:hypothetical protein